MESGSPFDWDEENQKHIARHGVTPDEAEQVLANDPLDLERQDINGEERFASVGLTDGGRWLLVVTTTRENKVRVVTAFDAGKRLVELYLDERKAI